MNKLFLAFVGLAYWVLAVWCVAQPARTAQSVGFTLTSGSGQSEYLVVYGGLQFALGAMFLLPLLDPAAERYALLLCLVVHVSLVVMRTVSFASFAGIGTMTYCLAAVEWAILLGSVWRWWGSGKFIAPHH